MSGDDGEWKFSLDDVGEEADADGAAASDVGDDSEADADEDGDASVAGEFAPRVPVVPERPRVENATAVTLGAALAVLVILEAALGAAFGPIDALLVVAVVGGFGALTYLAFRRFTPDT